MVIKDNKRILALLVVFSNMAPVFGADDGIRPSLPLTNECNPVDKSVQRLDELIIAETHAEQTVTHPITGAEVDPLWLALEHGKVETIKHVIDYYKKARVDVLPIQQDGCGLVHLAVKRGNQQILEMICRLADGAQADKRRAFFVMPDEENLTPYEFALAHAQSKMIDILDTYMDQADIDEAIEANREDDTDENDRDREMRRRAGREAENREISDQKRKQRNKKRNVKRRQKAKQTLPTLGRAKASVQEHIEQNIIAEHQKASLAVEANRAKQLAQKQAMVDQEKKQKEANVQKHAELIAKAQSEESAKEGQRIAQKHYEQVLATEQENKKSIAEQESRRVAAQEASALAIAEREKIEQEKRMADAERVRHEKQHEQDAKNSAEANEKRAGQEREELERNYAALKNMYININRENYKNRKYAERSTARSSDLSRKLIAQGAQHAREVQALKEAHEEERKNRQEQERLQRKREQELEQQQEQHLREKQEWLFSQQRARQEQQAREAHDYARVAQVASELTAKAHLASSHAYEQSAKAEEARRRAADSAQAVTRYKMENTVLKSEKQQQQLEMQGAQMVATQLSQQSGVCFAARWTPVVEPVYPVHTPQLDFYPIQQVIGRPPMQGMPYESKD